VEEDTMTIGFGRGLAGACRGFLASESGLAVTEYGLLLALVAVALVVAVRAVGGNIANWFSTTSTQAQAQATP
jgi:pilus assembly protein Flp/PilA